ncbi:hypothetical protein MNBD_ALPHA09-883 [hydrothermal vent metagenome]|uniref:Glutamine amidotransferase domain-containing protein n=1 Tax=hydrothermal vent metagenome TaxID=652676 RepID=A0A3B0T1P3_9ZZZZ
MTGFCLGILETGRPPVELIPAHGTSPDMFEALLAPAGPSIRYRAYRVVDGELPKSASECDGWLITGARAGVHDDEPWIAPLKMFLAEAHGVSAPIVGICFGHQILAVALGGRVENSTRGWGIGIHDYPVFEAANWMHRAVKSFAIEAMHEDQVVGLPPGAKVLAGSDHCPFALLAYGETAISFQGHPEFTAAYARDLIALRRGTLFSKALADDANASRGRPADADAVARWIANFLKLAVSRRSGR